ncbi:MAG TPA: hypothetical protein VF534_34510 [Paraburkholderia sp.]
MPLRTAIETLSASTDRELVTACISHYSGYLREAAIGRAVELGGSSFLESIAERVNDWVPEVRRSATNALLTLLAIVPAHHFVPLIPRLRGLMLATRADHRTWLLEFEQRLLQAGGSAAVIEAMTGADFRLRRAAYLVASDHQLLSVTEMVKRGLLSGDIVLAQRATALLGRVPASDRNACIVIATASPFGPVRYAAFKFVVHDHVDFDTEPFLWRTIFDSQGSLRSAAAQLLVESGRDVVKHCIVMLDAGALKVNQVRAGLSLLVDRGAPDAAAVLARYADDARTEVRAHAMMLQAKISPSLKDDIASCALLDSSRRVRKVGARLCTLGAFVSLDRIAAMLIQRGDRHAALTVCARDQWDCLACIALVTELQMQNKSDCANEGDALRKWIDNWVSSWTKPSNQHRQILSRPGVGSRLLDLAGDRQTKLRARLQEGGIEL